MQQGGYAPRQQQGGYAPRQQQGGYAPRQQQGYQARPYGGGNNYAPRQQQPAGPVLPAGKVVAFDGGCLDAKVAPASDGQQLLINSYTVQLPQRTVYQYELKFIADYGRMDQKVWDLSEIPTRNVEAHLRRRCLTRLYELLFLQHAVFFEADKMNKDGGYEHVYAYDRGATFYCSLNMKNRDEMNPFNIDITAMKPEEFDRLRKPKKVTATLVQTSVLDPREAEPAVIARYLDTLLSQHQLDRLHRFVKFGPKIFDLQSKVDISGGCELKDGHQKGVRVFGDGAELQIDAKISPFHQELTLLHYVNARLFLEPHDNFLSEKVYNKLMELRGLYVRTSHKANNEVFRIRGFSRESAQELKFDNRNGGQTSVADYFRNVYHYELQYPRFPCAIKKISGKESHYPLEVLMIQQGQKFPKDDMNSQQEQNMIQKAQRKPLEMLDEIERQKNLASITDQDQYIAAAQVHVSTNMNTVKSEVLCPPVITYNNNVAKQPADFQWDTKDAQFVNPVEINAMAIFYYNIPLAVAESTAYRFEQVASRLGVKIHAKQCIPLNDNQIDIQTLQDIIIDYRDKHGVDYVLAFAAGSQFHHILKATEVATNVPTQQVEPKTITNPKLGNVTIGNIIQKMNLKDGGCNQYFRQAAASQVKSENIDIFLSFMQTTMVMGFYMTHPSPGSSEENPSVCGYSFTTNKRGNVARGGFVYCKPRESILTEAELRKPLEDATKLYFEENKCYPDRVLVYRFGTSDGEIEKIQGVECETMIQGLAACMDGKIPKLTVISVRRQHNTRVFKQRNEINPRDRPPAQNVTPGTCVPGATELDFVMVPHRALQGTAKPTIYSTLFPTPEQNDLSENFLKNITHALCYMHEIVNSPISVPHTLRSAEQMANRGSKLWHSKGHELRPPLVEEEVYPFLTNALNPQIPTRYWA